MGFYPDANMQRVQKESTEIWAVFRTVPFALMGPIYIPMGVPIPFIFTW